MKNLGKWALFFSLLSCQVSSQGKKINVSSSFKNAHFVFSHNINGETHPCGCRQYPLGGIPQVAGALHELKTHSHVVYVDTGDTFFDTPILSDQFRESSLLRAEALGHALGKLGLTFFVPGDQDFAAGAKFLDELLKKNKITALISNLKGKDFLSHVPWAQLNFGKKRIWLIGVMNPNLFAPEFQSNFLRPELGMKRALRQIQKEGFDGQNPDHQLILLSHSGSKFDEKLAKNFPDIDWIIGAHDQRFLRTPLEVGQTRLVQTLSRNHYLGVISLFHDPKTSNDEQGQNSPYRLLEVREELAKKLPQNPWTPWLKNHKILYAEALHGAQSTLEQSGNSSTTHRERSYLGCAACHEAQTRFWQGTPHSLAMVTLVSAEEENNPQCLKCHSLPRDGKVRSRRELVLFEQMKENQHDPPKNKERFKSYWKEMVKAFRGSQTASRRSSDQMKRGHKVWSDLDEKYEIEQNYMNVQCLHCHDQSSEHPYQLNSKASQVNSDKCLQCHTHDQSPEWYQDHRTVSEKILKEKLKAVACPKQS